MIKGPTGGIADSGDSRVTRPPPSSDISFGLVVAALIAVGTWYRWIWIVRWGNSNSTASPITDDGFYYLEIARNIAHFGRVTFDGINPTNGVHPLWALLLAVVAGFNPDRLIMLSNVLWLQLLLFVLAGGLLAYYVRTHVGVVASLLAVAMWSISPGLIRWQFIGMENSIWTVSLLAALIAIDTAIHSHSWKSMTFLSIAMMSLVLARTDTILLCGIVVVLLAASSMGHARRSHRTVALVALASSAIASLCVVVFNFVAARSLFSVSATAKLGWAATGGASIIGEGALGGLSLVVQHLYSYFSGLAALLWGSNRYNIAAQSLAALWLSIVLCLWLTRLARGRISPSDSSVFQHISLVSLYVYAGLHVLMVSSVLSGHLRYAQWYLVPEIISFSIILPSIVYPPWATARLGLLAGKISHTVSLSGSIISRRAVAKAAIGTVSLSLAIPSIWSLNTFMSTSTSKMSMPSPAIEMANWLNANVPSTARVGMIDSGTVGYYADAHVVNLDGLTNSPDYLDYIGKHSVAEYLVSNRFEYAVVYHYEPTYSFDLGVLSPSSSESVCWRTVHRNAIPAEWYLDRPYNNYWQVVSLRYNAPCTTPWRRDYPFSSTD